MKIFGKTSLSSLLFWIFNLSWIGCMIGFIFVGISLISNNYAIAADNQFAISIPFTGSAIKGEYTVMTFVAIIALLLFYGVFFYILRTIFKSFVNEEQLFTKKVITYFKGFALINILFPPLVLIAGYMVKGQTDFETILQIGLHVLLGIFCLFVVAIFNMGYILQEDTKLTI